MVYPFILVTYRAGDQQYPVRLAVAQIVSYSPCPSGGSVIEMVNQESYSIMETVDQLDTVIDASWGWRADA